MIESSGEVEAWLEPVLERRAAQCHPRLLEWQGEESTRSNLRRSLRDELEWLGKPEVRDGFAAACPVDGASPDEYGIRFLRLPGFGTVLAGIHFYGLDLGRPFVHLSALDFELDDDALGELRKLLRAEFEVFRPRSFRVWVDGEGTGWEGRPDVELDGYCLAGSLAEIQASEPPAERERISLVPDSTLATFPDFDACYREYLGAHPGYERWLEPGERGELEACARLGANHRVHVDGEPAGWIAGRRGDFGPVSGWLVIDELLEPAFRSRGFAPAMQRAFLDTLPDDELIWGTIDARNTPSLATARRVGRVIVQAGLFFSLAP